VLTRPSKKNGQTGLPDIRKIIKDNKQAPAYGLRTPRNSKIRGWAHDHPHASATATFVHGDPAIGHALGRWARRRHPQKNPRWIADHYFGQGGNKHGRCFGKAKDPQGNTIHHWLCLASATPVTRPIKIKGDCNPDAPAGELYLAERLGVKMDKTLRGQRPVIHLWKEPGGICPVCAPPLTKMPGWPNPPMGDKTLGGTDRADHRVLIHANCPRQVHATGLTGSNPRPAQAASSMQPGA
jgi:RNA-directed DNA polymerase